MREIDPPDRPGQALLRLQLATERDVGEEPRRRFRQPFPDLQNGGTGDFAEGDGRAHFSLRAGPIRTAFSTRAGSQRPESID